MYRYGPFRRASTDRKLDYEEFLAATVSIKQLERRIREGTNSGGMAWPEVLRKAFGLFDVDGDGVISEADLRACLASDRSADPASLERLVRECMAEADVEGDGAAEEEDLRPWP